MQFTCDAGLASIVRPGLILFGGIHVAPRSAAMHAAIERAEAALRAARDAGPVPQAVRTMYHRVGIDPTRTRPSSEALWRRVLRGEPLPAISNVVDVGNWCSVESHLPFGLYDLDRVRGSVVLRRGRAGESYAGIRKDLVNVEGRLTLADDEGPFGNPTSDSARTMVTADARSVMFVVFAPASCDARVLQDALDLTAARMGEFVGAVETTRFVAGVESYGGSRP